jgi:drug/metabolite transporter (DMT)-like permease
MVHTPDEIPEPTPQSPTSDIRTAALWMIGAVVSFCAMAVMGRTALTQLDTFELMMYRSFVGVIVVLSYIAVTNKWHEVTLSYFKLHLIRNLFHFAGQNLWFAALVMIPIAQVFAIEFTSPIWILLLSPALLNERMTRGRAITAVLGFIGILIVTRPSLETLNMGIFFVALASICFALTSVLTRRLTRTQSIASILFYLTVLQAIFGAVTAGYDGDITLPSLAIAPSVVAVGFAGLAAHTCLTRALSLAPAASIMPIDFARLPIIAVVGYLLYNESIDIYVFIGAAIIFGANYVNLLRETRAEGLEKAAPNVQGK